MSEMNGRVEMPLDEFIRVFSNSKEYTERCAAWESAFNRLEVLSKNALAVATEGAKYRSLIKSEEKALMEFLDITCDDLEKIYEELIKEEKE